MGHRFIADAMVSAVWMPYFFAGRDFAVTMPWRVFSSPPTTEGIVRRSTAEGSSFRRFTALQERNAEFTST